MEDEKRGAQAPEAAEPSDGHATLYPNYETGPIAGSSVAEAPPQSSAPSFSRRGRIPPPAPPDGGDDSDQEDDGMLRMSFLEHLEELRSRIIRALYGLALSFLLALIFAGKLWDIIKQPAVVALKHLGVVPPRLVMITPMESFSIIWVKLPLLCSIFIASPWVLYQAWAFIAPGLYKRERRMAIPAILTTAGLFITGGMFAYFLAFRYGLEFLLGIGMSNDVQPVVTITEYFDLFVNVTLGVGLVFELPILIFTLTLLRLASPRFLIQHSRYAILAIVIIAAIVTPTPDVFNLMLFAIPMCVLYFVGVFAGYLLVLRREGRKFPWGRILLVVAGLLLLLAAVVAIAVVRYHYRFLTHWPYFTR